MSRINFENFGPFGELVVGWDPPMAEFFVQGWRVGSYWEDDPALWEMRWSLEELTCSLGAIGVVLPDEVAEKLAEHAATDSEELLAWDNDEKRLWGGSCGLLGPPPRHSFLRKIYDTLRPG